MSLLPIFYISELQITLEQCYTFYKYKIRQNVSVILALFSYVCFVYPLRPALDCCQLLPRWTLERYVTFQVALWVFEFSFLILVNANLLAVPGFGTTTNTSTEVK